jgi:hypothetical protein
MDKPPPLPPRVSPQMADEPPETLAYQPRVAVTRGGIGGNGLALAGAAALSFQFGIFLWSLAVVVIWMLIVVLVLPRFELIFADFKMSLPVTTRMLFLSRKVVLYGGFVPLLLLPVILGFVSAPLSPGGRRALRMVITLLFGLLVGFTVFALAQPMMTMMDGMSSSGGR